MQHVRYNTTQYNKIFKLNLLKVQFDPKKATFGVKRLYHMFEFEWFKLPNEPQNA